MTPRIKIKSVTYQRNGCFGAGFFVVLFTERDGRKNRRMCGHVYPPHDDAPEGTKPEYYGVVDLDNPTECWRGDYYLPAMWEAVRAVKDTPAPYDRSRWAVQWSTAPRRAKLPPNVIPFPVAVAGRVA